MHAFGAGPEQDPVARSGAQAACCDNTIPTANASMVGSKPNTTQYLSREDVAAGMSTADGRMNCVKRWFGSVADWSDALFRALPIALHCNRSRHLEWPEPLLPPPNKGATRNMAMRATRDESMGDCGVKQPWLYVYELPATYRRRGTVGADTFPPLVRPPALAPGTSVELRDAHSTHVVGGIFYERAMAHPCLTTEHSRADLLFVPAYDGMINSDTRKRACEPRCGKLLASIARRQRHRLVKAKDRSSWIGSLRQDGSSVHADIARACSKDALVNRLLGVAPPGAAPLDRRAGRDHIFLSERQGTFWDTRPCYWEADLLDQRWGEPTRLALEEGSARFDWPELRTLPYFSSVPYSSYVHADHTTPPSQLPWRVLRARPLLASLAANPRHHTILGSKGLFERLRLALLRSCKRPRMQGVGVKQSWSQHAELPAGKRSCIFLPLAPAVNRTLRPNASDLFEVPGYHVARTVQVVHLYSRSVFCLQPVGDTCSRKGIIDSVLLGCIPVLFHPCQLLQWPWHWGDWVREASVFLNFEEVSAGTVDVVAELGRIPGTDVVRKQVLIAESGHCLHYFRRPAQGSPVRRVEKPQAAGAIVVGHLPDAFEIALQGSWREARRKQGLPLPEESGIPAEGGLCQSEWHVVLELPLARHGRLVEAEPSQAAHLRQLHVGYMSVTCRLHVGYMRRRRPPTSTLATPRRSSAEPRSRSNTWRERGAAASSPSRPVKTSRSFHTGLSVFLCADVECTCSRCSRAAGYQGSMGTRQQGTPTSSAPAR